jgi:hypothetical protein
MQHAIVSKTDPKSHGRGRRRVLKKQTNAYGTIPVRALCDSRLSGLIPLPDLINHAAGIEKADDGCAT